MSHKLSPINLFFSRMVYAWSIQESGLIVSPPKDRSTANSLDALTMSLFGKRVLADKGTWDERVLDDLGEPYIH